MVDPSRSCYQMRCMRYEMSEANRNVGRDVGTCANYSESCSLGARQPTNERRSLPQLNGSLAWAPRRGYLKTSRTHTQQRYGIGMMIGPRTGGRRHRVLLMSSACRRWGLSGRCNCIGTSGCWDGRKFGNVAGLLYYIHTTCPPHCTALLEARQPINEHRRHCQDAYYCGQHRR